MTCTVFQARKHIIGNMEGIKHLQIVFFFHYIMNATIGHLPCQSKLIPLFYHEKGYTLKITDKCIINLFIHVKQIN